MARPPRARTGHASTAPRAGSSAAANGRANSKPTPSNSPANAQSDINGEADLLVQLLMSLAVPDDFRDTSGTVVPLQLWDNKSLKTTHNDVESNSGDTFDKRLGETMGEASTPE